MLEIALSRLDIESVMGCSDIDLSVFPLADRTELVLEYIIVEIALTLVAVVADKTVRLGYQPDVLLTVFHHAVNTDNVLQCTANLVGPCRSASAVRVPMCQSVFRRSDAPIGR